MLCVGEPSQSFRTSLRHTCEMNLLSESRARNILNERADSSTFFRATTTAALGRLCILLFCLCWESCPAFTLKGSSPHPAFSTSQSPNRGIFPASPGILHAPGSFHRASLGLLSPEIRRSGFSACSFHGAVCFGCYENTCTFTLKTLNPFEHSSLNPFQPRPQKKTNMKTSKWQPSFAQSPAATWRRCLPTQPNHGPSDVRDRSGRHCNIRETLCGCGDPIPKRSAASL